MARALTAITIGPLHPDGRSGVAADLKAFASLGLHGGAVATEVAGEDLPAGTVVSQLEAVLGTTQIDIVKLLCPLQLEVLYSVVESLANRRPRLVVEAGTAALREETMEALRSRLLPLAHVLVVDQAEAARLSGQPVGSWDQSREAARVLADFGAANVVIKGDKLDPSGRVTDLLFDGEEYRDYTADRIQLGGVVGAGTTFAAAIAATLAKGETVQHSVAAAKAYVTKALQSTYDVGNLPSLHHFYRYWQPSG